MAALNTETAGAAQCSTELLIPFVPSVPILVTLLSETRLRGGGGGLHSLDDSFSLFSFLETTIAVQRVVGWTYAINAQYGVLPLAVNRRYQRFRGSASVRISYAGIIFFFLSFHSFHLWKPAVVVEKVN